MVQGTSLYVKTQKPNLYNALVHVKGKEMNEGEQHLPFLPLSPYACLTSSVGRSEGDKFTLQEIQEAVNADESLQDLDSDDEERLRSLLGEKRKTKVQGARANNKAASLDASAVMQKMQQEVRPTLSEDLPNAHYRCSSTTSANVQAFLPLASSPAPMSTTPLFLDGSIRRGRTRSLLNSST